MHMALISDNTHQEVVIWMEEEGLKLVVLLVQVAPSFHHLARQVITTVIIHNNNTEVGSITVLVLTAVAVEVMVTFTMDQEAHRGNHTTPEMVIHLLSKAAIQNMDLQPMDQTITAATRVRRNHNSITTVNNTTRPVMEEMATDHHTLTTRAIDNPITITTGATIVEDREGTKAVAVEVSIITGEAVAATETTTLAVAVVEVITITITATGHLILQLTIVIIHLSTDRLLIITMVHQPMAVEVVVVMEVLMDIHIIQVVTVARRTLLDDHPPLHQKGEMNITVATMAALVDRKKVTNHHSHRQTKECCCMQVN